ncbi:hypothetical protein BLNAU_23050 [Blattamonas nauphoetae]|uniref:Autophagy-related protein 2 n=1 Tax=Blattamonas nauphoetae TaxID=2049346 RepID=A0ABQ9WRA9_9EUKA|nr:hypothetical protein BLNAU_23050 [Blattamonas nauphoetae]
MQPQEITLPPHCNVPNPQLLEPPSSPPPDSSVLSNSSSPQNSISQHSQSTSSQPILPQPSDFRPDEDLTNISKPTAISRSRVSKEEMSSKKGFDPTALHETIETLELDWKRLKEELSQMKPTDNMQVDEWTQTPLVESGRPNAECLPVSGEKPQGQSVMCDLTDVFSIRASLGTMLGVDERCVRIRQNNRDLATEWQSNCIFSSLSRWPVEISLVSPYVTVTLVIARNVNRIVKLGRFETLGSLKEKAAEIEDTDVRCISFVKVFDPIIDDDDAPKQSDPDYPASPATPNQVESIELSDDVELGQLTNGTTLAILTDISPLVIEVTLRTNNKSTAIEMNRFEKMETLLAPAAALLGKDSDDVTLWCDGFRVNPSLALDSLSAHFSLLPQHIRADHDEDSHYYQTLPLFWLPDAPARLTLDVMGRDFGMGVVVVCGEEKKEFSRVSCRTSGLEMKKMVGDWLEVDWRRIRLWKDEPNAESETIETGRTDEKKEETTEGSSRTNRSKETKQFMSEAGRVRSMTHTRNLTLHCRIAPASMRIIARTAITKHTLNVESWERIGTVRTKIARVMKREGEKLSLFLGEKELRDWDVVSGLTEDSKMEISVLEWPGMVLVAVQVDGKAEEHSMSASATLRSLSRRVMISNRHLSASSLTFTQNDTPLALSTRLISLGLSPSLVATPPQAPEQLLATPVAPSTPSVASSTSSDASSTSSVALPTRIPTTLCGFRMDVDTITQYSNVPLKKFHGTANFAQVNLVNIKTGALVPFTLIPDRWKPKIELTTPLTYSDLVDDELNLRYELKPECVEVQLKLEDHPIVVVHTSVLRTSLSSLAALKHELERQVLLEVKVLLEPYNTIYHYDRQRERQRTADVLRLFKNEFSLPPLHFNSALLTDDTLSALRHHTHIDLTCSVPSHTSFITVSHNLMTYTIIVPSSLSTHAVFSTIKQTSQSIFQHSIYSSYLFTNGHLFDEVSKLPIGALFDTPILNVTLHKGGEKVLVNTISLHGRKKQVRIDLYPLRDFVSQFSSSGDLIAKPRSYSFYHNFFEYYLPPLGTRSPIDVRLKWNGSDPTIRVVSTPAIHFRFFDADGNRRCVISQLRPDWRHRKEFDFKSVIKHTVESGYILRFVDGQEEDSETDGIDEEWDETSDTTSEESSADQDEDTHTEEETEEGDLDSYDPDVDLKSEYSFDSINNIHRLHDELYYTSNSDYALPSDERESIKRADRKLRRKIATRYNKKYNTSRTPKYPIQPPFTTVSLRLVKVRAICRLCGAMDATVECILHFVRSHFVTIRNTFDQILTLRLAVFLSKPICVLDVEVKKMRRTGQTQFESTVVESVEVVADVEVRSEIVEVSVEVVSGLMECSEMEGTLKEDHFSFSLPLSSSFLSLERLLRDQLPQLGNVCWIAEPTDPSDDNDSLSSEDSCESWYPYRRKKPYRDNVILNPNLPIFVGNEFPSLPIRLRAKESRLPDNPFFPRRWSWDLESLSSHSSNPSTTHHPLDISSISEQLNLCRLEDTEFVNLKSEQDSLSQSTASPNCQREESQSPLRLWIETPMRRVMGLFAGSATVHDVLFFVGSLNCVSVCAPLSFHEHALFAGDEKLDGLVTHSQSTSSQPILPQPSDFRPDELLMDISKPTSISRNSTSKEEMSSKKGFDPTALHETIETLELELKRLKEELSQMKPTDNMQVDEWTQTPIVESGRQNSECLPVSGEKPQGQSVMCDLTDVFSIRASLGTMLGVDERCVRIRQNNRDLATEWQSNCIFSSLSRWPVEISLVSPYVTVTLVIARNVNRIVKLGRFETLGSLKEKAAEIEDTDVRCVSFVDFWEPFVDDGEPTTQSDPDSSVYPDTTYQVESTVLSDDVELDQLTNGTTLALLTDISPLVIEVTLRTNNSWTAIEMNRFEKMDTLLAPAAALLGKDNADVTLWCDGVRVNPSLALDSLSAHFSLLPQHIHADSIEEIDEHRKLPLFWLPDAPARLTLDVMGSDFGMGVVVVCGEEKKEFSRVSCRTSGLEMKKMVGEWLEVDWRRIRLWKDEQNEEGETNGTGQTNEKKKKTAEGSSRTKRSTATIQFMSETGRVRNMTRTRNLTLHCRIAPASMRIIARTAITKHTLNVESWERIGTVRTKIARVMKREGEKLSLFLGEKELRDWDVVNGLTDESEMEISVLEWPGMMLVEVRVDGKAEEHSMSASATLRSLSRRFLMSNRHLSASSLSFTQNDTPLALSTRLISLGLSPSLVATPPPPPEQPLATPIAPSTRIPTTLCGFRMDMDTITQYSNVPLKKFHGTANFAQVNLVNIKTGALVPFTLIPDRWKPKIELTTPLTYSDLVAGKLNLRYELRPEFVTVQLKLNGHPIEVLHTSVLRNALSSLSALESELERHVVQEVKELLETYSFSYGQDRRSERAHRADVLRLFTSEFNLPPLHFNSALLTDDTLSALRNHSHIDLTCSVPSDTMFITLTHELNTHTFVVPSYISTQAVFDAIDTTCRSVYRYYGFDQILLVNGRLFDNYSTLPIGALFDTPILNVTLRRKDEEVLVNKISLQGRGRL